MQKQIKELHELSESIYMSGYALDWKDSDDIAEQLYNAGYRKQEWISVEERLPENDYDKHWKDRKRYLVFTEPCGIMFVATYGHKEHDWWVNGDHLVLEKRNYREVTHWMPLTEPPKGE